MKKLYIAIPLLVICGFVGLGLSPSDTVAQPEKPKTKWEYKAISFHELIKLAPKTPDGITGGLNQLGGEGWELVTVSPFGRDVSPTFCLKRAK